MRPRQPVPRLWLMTDERIGDALWSALRRLPRGAGVVFRHHGTPAPERRTLFDRVRSVARRRQLVLVLAGTAAQARSWKADGAHGQQRRRRSGLPLTRSAHSQRELVRAARRGATLVFVSPVWPTRSHPGSPALGRVRLGLMVRNADGPVIALGGMSARRARALPPGIYGWAGIDGWLPPTSARRHP